MFNFNVGLDEDGVSLYISVPNDLHAKLEKMGQHDRCSVEDSAAILLEAVLAKLSDNARISDVLNQIESTEQPAPKPQKLDRLS